MKKYTIIIIIIVIIIMGIIFAQKNNNSQQTTNSSSESTVHSPYAGQEMRSIKALSEDDINGLFAGEGAPFGGMAKPAELNGYPGPRHVLDAMEAGDFEVTVEQKQKIEALHEEMKAQAISLGKKIVALEQVIDDKFSDRTMTEEYLQEKVMESAELYGQLRIVHLKYHLSMVDILTSEQVAMYNELRGYTSGGNPCESIPEGVHDLELWKKHNNCE